MKGTHEPEHTLCQVRIPLPGETGTYMKRVSIAYPDALIEVLSYLPVGKGSVLMNFRISGDFPLDEAVDSIRKSEDVTSVDVLDRGSKSSQIRVESELARMPIVRAAGELRLLPEFPAYVRNGVLTAIIAGTSEQIRSFLKVLDVRFPGSKVLAIRHDGIEGPKGLLTDHQLVVFRAALRAGYWDVPRRISLSEIAEQLQTSKSTVSETLATIEKRLIEEASERFVIPD